MSIGPLLLPPHVFAVLIGIISLMILTTTLARRVHKQFDAWLTVALIAMAVSARLGFVVRHWSSFAEEPWRVFYIWQGGFELTWGLVAGVVSVLFLSGWRRRGLGLGTLIVSGMAAWIALSFTPQPPQHPLPDLSLPNLAGETLNLADYGQEPVVLNLWATWCGPCRREMPMLEQAVQQHPTVRFFFVNQGESAQTVQTYLAQEGLAMQDSILLDLRYAVAKLYETKGTPTTLFFRDNLLVATHVGEISAEKLQDYLRLIKAEQ